MGLTAFSKNRQTVFIVAALLLLVLVIPIFFGNISAATKNSLNIENFDAAYNAGQISASATVKNVSSGKIRFTPTLAIEKPGTYRQAGESLIVSASSLLWYEDSRSFVTLDKNEERKVNFNFFLSSHLPEGNYNFSLKTSSEFGESLATANTRKSLKGDGNFLGLNQDDCKVIKTTAGVEKAFPTFVAAPFKISESVKAVCNVKNTTSTTIQAKEAFHTNVLRAFGFYLANPQTSYGDVLTFAPGETKQVSLVLPTKSTPQVYDATFQFVEPNNSNNRLSSTVALRWTVVGPAGRIESVKVNSLKDSLFGKDIGLKIGVYGPPDVYWKGTLFGNEKFSSSTLNGVVQVQVIGKGGAICGKAETPLENISTDTVSSKDLTVSAGICQEPTLSVKILDKNSVVLSSIDGVLVAGVQNISPANYLLVIIGVLAILLLVLGYYLLIKRLKK